MKIDNKTIPSMYSKKDIRTRWWNTHSVKKQCCLYCSENHDVPMICFENLGVTKDGYPEFYDTFFYYCEKENVFFEDNPLRLTNKAAREEVKEMIHMHKEYPEAIKGDIYLNSWAGDLWIVDDIDGERIFIKINDGCIIDVDEPEGFVKVGHVDNVENINISRTTVSHSQQESKNIQLFDDIMKRYRDGEFGDKSLSMYEILKKAGHEKLLYEMSENDIHILRDRSNCGFTKLMFTNLLHRKLAKESE